MTPGEFLEKLSVFGDLPEAGAFMDAYLDNLEKFSSEVLAAAVSTILASRKIRKFPLPAECIEACQEVENRLELKKTAGKLRQGSASKRIPLDGKEWSKERIEMANRMMRSEVGRLAAQEGWIVALHDFCREQKRLPTKFEALDIREAALARRAQNREMAAAMTNPPKFLKAIEKAMESKRKRLSEIARQGEESVSGQEYGAAAEA
jgi:hypothetical protein